MFWTDRTSSEVCAATVPGNAATSSRKARRNMQLYSFSPFELVIGKRVIGASAEKFRSEDQSVKRTETSNKLPSLSLTTRQSHTKQAHSVKRCLKYYNRFILLQMRLPSDSRAGSASVQAAHAFCTGRPERLHLPILLVGVVFEERHSMGDGRARLRP